MWLCFNMVLSSPSLHNPHILSHPWLTTPTHFLPLESFLFMPCQSSYLLLANYVIPLVYFSRGDIFWCLSMATCIEGKERIWTKCISPTPEIRKILIASRLKFLHVTYSNKVIYNFIIFMHLKMDLSKSFKSTVIHWVCLHNGQISCWKFQSSHSVVWLTRYHTFGYLFNWTISNCFSILGSMADYCLGNNLYFFI